MLLQKVLLDQQIVQLLIGLNDAFSPARAHILMFCPPPNMVEVHSILLQDVEQRKIFSKSSSTGVLSDQAFALTASRFGAGRGSPSTPGRGRGSGINSGTSVGNGRSTSGGKSSLYCDNCKIGGHTLETCWKIHGQTIFCEFCNRGGHIVEKC